MRSTGRCLIAAITICSWIAISNHCALNAAVAKPSHTAGGCPFHSKPAKPHQKPAGTECCKILRATATTPVKISAPALIDVLPPDLPELVIPCPPKISIEPSTLDTGPPGKTSFAELSQSVRAHAPPLLA